MRRATCFASFCVSRNASRWIAAASPVVAPQGPVDDLGINFEEITTPADMKPRDIVAALDKYIIGQGEAKRSVAVALRNRWRRHRVAPRFKEEIYPKNILMIGPTGVGKTEIARRVAKLTDAPFIRVECTKFTEVGYHGRDVDSLVEDLYKASMTLLKNKIRDMNKDKVKKKAREVVLKALCGDSNSEDFAEFLDSGVIKDQEVVLEVPRKPPPMPKDMQGQVQMEEIMRHLQGGKQTVSQKMTIAEALKMSEEIEMEKLLDDEKLAHEALRCTEQYGIVVLDEIDKICQPSEAGRKGVSGEGVQQDLLPLVEGTTVTLKNGIAVKTDHVLFIASGAFQLVKPSDMIAELQGRLPLRVNLNPLTKNDFYRILTEPKANLIYQNKELFKTESVTLEVQDEAIHQEMADVAFQANATVQNIGARRLITVVERVLEDLAFNAPDLAGQTVTVTPELVRERVGDMLKAQDLTKLII